MKVTIELGKRAMDFVTGIPEEELPFILADVVERSLEQQVKPIEEKTPSSMEKEEGDFIAKLKTILKGVDVRSSSESQGFGSIFAPKKKETRIEKVETSAPIELGDEFDDFGFFK